jgi:hypothetical protein
MYLICNVLFHKVIFFNFFILKKTLWQVYKETIIEHNAVY